MNQVETIWLASQFPLLVCYCGDYRHLNQAVFRQVSCSAFLLCGMGHSFQWRTQEFCLWEGGSTNSVEDREWESGGGSPLVRGSGGSCNLVQEISFHIVKFS